jgi:hypothetical protein
LLLVLCLALPAFAQNHYADDNPYSRKNTFDIFGEYSNDSSHIILGVTPNRKLAGIGVQYERRLIEHPNFRLSYDAEFRPFIVNSDPASAFTETNCVSGDCTTFQISPVVTIKCVAGTQTYPILNQNQTQIGTGTLITACSRQLTLAQGASPAGVRLAFFPRKPLQLSFSSDAGYMFATHAIPIAQAGAFNFTFNFGGGLEYFYKPRRSIRLEYLVQHYSNKYTADQNPGVDSGFIRLNYAFGR